MHKRTIAERQAIVDRHKRFIAAVDKFNQEVYAMDPEYHEYADLLRHKTAVERSEMQAIEAMLTTHENTGPSRPPELR